LLWTSELPLISLCGIPEAELEAPDWLLVEGVALWLLEGDELDEGFVLWSVVEGEALCELLEEDGEELDDGEL
jgi:hypothetical protein